MRQYDINNMAKVLGLVAGYIEDQFAKQGSASMDGPGEVPEFQVFIVFYTYILGGYKATVGSSLDDYRYYEVTYNPAKREWYIDVYQKVENICIADDRLKVPLN